VKVLRKKKAQIRKIATSQRRAHTEIPSVACKGGRQVAHRESPERHFYQIQMLFNPSLPAQNRGIDERNLVLIFILSLGSPEVYF
jgi:hypothetical protein